MIIEHIAGKKTDTDKLSDVQAMIMEKCEELRTLCCNENRQLVILVDAKGREDGIPLTFWNFKTKDYNVDDVEVTNKAYNTLIHMIHLFLMTISNKELGVSKMEKSE